MPQRAQSEPLSAPNKSQPTHSGHSSVAGSRRPHPENTSTQAVQPEVQPTASEDHTDEEADADGDTDIDESHTQGPNANDSSDTDIEPDVGEQSDADVESSINKEHNADQGPSINAELNTDPGTNKQSDTGNTSRDSPPSRKRRLPSYDDEGRRKSVNHADPAKYNTRKRQISGSPSGQ